MALSTLATVGYISLLQYIQL